MQSETRICQNCKKDFIIESDDFSFYEKIKVLPPMLCSDCQFVNRMVFRNQNILYHRTNNTPDSNNKKIISVYSEDKNIKIYDQKYWRSDKWDVLSYGHDYDFSKPFFKQIEELIKKVPWPNLMNWNAINSEYCNYTEDNKNCYLVFGGDYNENCSYATFNMHSRESLDLFLVEKCEFCYECIDCQECYKVSFARYSKNCSDCIFLYDCINCVNCVGCVGLRNKSYFIFNQQYSKEEYEKEIKELQVNTRNGLEFINKKFEQLKIKFPHRYAHILRSTGCTGDNIINSKNCINCFDLLSNAKDLKNAFLAGDDLTDSRNLSHTGHGSELIYNSFAIFGGCKNIKFSMGLSSSVDCTYSYNCPSGFNLFGCVGVKSGNYCILNKQYTKEQYEELVPKIIKHMSDMPYIDSKGRIYKYGEFFPPELSPFCYNETIAQEYFPLTKEEAEEQGYKWKEREERNYNIDIYSKDIPNDIKEVEESIINKVIECEHKGQCNEQCTEAFKIIGDELSFYKRMNIPIPHLCPNCRHYNRLKQ
ncbi:MAG: hypothetical protein WCS86_03860, partial [Candidatus Paceibacterota bacterium]